MTSAEASIRLSKADDAIAAIAALSTQLNRAAFDYRWNEVLGLRGRLASALVELHLNATALAEHNDQGRNVNRI